MRKYLYTIHEKNFYSLIIIFNIFSFYFFLFNDSKQKEYSSNTDLEESINNNNIEQPIIEEVDPVITIHIGGDSMLAEHVGQYMIELGMNPFQFFIDRFNSDDLTVINLETNISTPGVGVQRNKSYTFNAPLVAFERMISGGVDVVSLANNHTMDFGESGMVDMLSLLKNNNIKFFGAGNNLDEAFEPLITDVKGTKIAWIGLNDVEGYSQDAGANKSGSATFNKEKTLNSLKKQRIMLI